MDKEKDSEKHNKADILSQNYDAMNETGKEKLKEISDLILKIHKTIYEKRRKNRA